MYCDKCSSTIEYLCYSTYGYFKFSFVCNCGEDGSIEIGNKECMSNIAADMLLLKKGRLRCPYDQSPLFSIVEKNLRAYNYKAVCKECLSSFETVI
jgi:hypothetical protein